MVASGFYPVGVSFPQKTIELSPPRLMQNLVLAVTMEAEKGNFRGG
jgi:hypothetical protein